VIPIVFLEDDARAQVSRAVGFAEMPPASDDTRRRRRGTRRDTAAAERDETPPTLPFAARAGPDGLRGGQGDRPRPHTRTQPSAKNVL